MKTSASMSRPILVIIPGIGDDTKVYYSFAKRWQRLGFDAHVISFRWTDAVVPFTAAMNTFQRQLDRFGDRPLLLIGVSAGGTAALNIMAERSNVHKVITICSPLQAMSNLQNPLLAASINQLVASWPNFTMAQQQRVLSVYALYDQVVAVRLSQLPGAGQRRIFSFIHAPTIYIAMIFYARSLSAFFKK